MPPAANAQQPSQQQQTQHRYKDGQPQHRSSSSRTVNPTTGMPDRVGNYSIREEIGRGSFATVYRGEKLTTNPATLVAIKAVVRSKLTTKLLENLESEIRLLKGIKQRNVVELVDCLKTEAHIYLVMAYCSAGDLSQYIRKRGQIPNLTSSMQQTYRERYPHPRDGGLNELVVRCFLGQLAEALKFLRNQNIIHRDIKPQNLLLHPPDSSDIAAGHPQGIPLLRVADFGFARALPNTSLAETLCGSPLYMAPEILRYEKYDAKADLWSVGAVTYEMTVGKPPFRAQNHVELLRRIERGEDRIKFPDDRSPSASTEPGKEELPPTKVPDDLKALIRGLLKRNPVERMSFADFFREADGVARWGEGSLVAPGTIDQVRSQAPSRQSSSQDQLPRPDSDTRIASGRTSPTNVKKASPLIPSPAPSPIIKDLSAATATAIVPSSGEEQEMAFVQLPNAAGQRTSPPDGMTRVSGERSSMQDQAGTPSARPSAPTRRSTFKPKYVVGSEAEQNQTSAAPLKTRDYAVITTTAATPTTAQPGPPLKAHSRQPSQDNLVPPQQVLANNAPQTTPMSNLTLALPTARDRQLAQQRDMIASAMTGDDDSILGREYVVVDKRNVEFNALADEMASNPRRLHTIPRRNSRGILSRQPTGYGQSPSAPVTYGNVIANHDAQSPSPPSPALPYPPTAQATSYEHPPFAAPITSRLSPAPYGSSPRSRGSPSIPPGQSSPGRYVSTASTPLTSEQTYTSPLSIVGGITLPSNAIGKALNMASLKLFGSPSENIWLRKQSHRLPFGRRRTRPAFASEDTPSAEEEELMQRLEDIAQKATVIFDFADSKLVMMQPHSSQQSLLSNQRSPLLIDGSANATGSRGGLGASQANPFFASANNSTASPGMANRRSSSSSDQRPSSPLAKTAQAVSNSGTSVAVATSTSSSKADLLLGETLVLYLKALAFLSKGIEQARDFWSARNAGQAASADLNEYVQWLRARFNECFDKAEYAKGRLVGDIPDSAMLAEKLIFDRALEMSRAAAVSELMGENAQECEIAYDTALWMLHAILDETMQEGELVDEDDTVTVRNFIESIKGRLAALRRKMRNSTTM